jgi:rSAM/selenodomain-associated transferase 2
MISVVIPTLNAEAGLAATLDRLRVGTLRVGTQRLIQEIIVSDGGSLDATIEIATRANCRVFRGPPGRGEQLSYGARQAEGRWLLFLHADTCLAAGWEDAASEFVRRTGTGRRAAVFTFKLDDPAKSALVLEQIVALRGRALGLPYGDQGLLLSRCFYDELGGFRPLPIMEDVDLVRRIGRARLETLAVPAVTSSDRYRRNGYLPRMARNAACLLLYFIGVPPKSIARIYE